MRTTTYRQQFEHLALSVFVAAVTLLVMMATAGCANTSTVSETEYFSPAGDLLARERERTRRNTLAMKTEASRIDATMERTNRVSSGGQSFESTSVKRFGTDAFKTEGQADVIKAFFSGIGEATAAFMSSGATPAIKAIAANSSLSDRDKRSAILAILPGDAPEAVRKELAE